MPSGRGITDIAGQTFGRLQVIGVAELRVQPSGHRRCFWNCLCVCGQMVVANGTSLRSGMVRSCGCLRREVVRARRMKHGHSLTGPHHSKEYRAWQNLKRRCDSPSHKDFRDYGGRGIRVAPEWLADFMAFYNHIGPAPSPKHQVDRIDVNGHYEPGNVRWVTALQQRHNQRRYIARHGASSVTLAEGG